MADHLQSGSAQPLRQQLGTAARGTLKGVRSMASRATFQSWLSNYQEKIVNGGLSERTKSTKRIETLVERAWRAFGAAYPPPGRRNAQNPRDYADLHVFKSIEAILRQPIVSIGTSTRQYGTYSKCKPVRPVTRRVRYHVQYHFERGHSAELAVAAEYLRGTDHDPGAPGDW
jgi:hypothetical protein